MIVLKRTVSLLVVAFLVLFAPSTMHTQAIGDDNSITCGSGPIVAGTFLAYGKYMPIEIINLEYLELFNDIDMVRSIYEFEVYQYTTQVLFLLILTTDEGNTLYIVGAVSTIESDETGEDIFLLSVFDDTHLVRNQNGDTVNAVQPCAVWTASSEAVFEIVRLIVMDNVIEISD